MLVNFRKIKGGFLKIININLRWRIRVKRYGRRVDKLRFVDVFFVIGDLFDLFLIL